MCTSITYSTRDHYFGRNFDYELSYEEVVTITPRNYKLSFRKVITALCDDRDCCWYSGLSAVL